MEEVFCGKHARIWQFENPERRSFSTYQYGGERKRRIKEEYFMVERFGAILNVIDTPGNLEKVVEAARLDERERKAMRKVTHQRINEALGEPKLCDFFNQPKVGVVRGLERIDFKGRSLDDLAVAAYKLERWQYLSVSKEFEIIPGGIDNFRKKGLFLNIERRRGKTLREAARAAILGMGTSEVYVGMRHMDKTDNGRREYALVALIEGHMLHNLLGSHGQRSGLHFNRCIDLREEYSGAGEFTLHVPSSSDMDKQPYRVNLSDIRTKEGGTSRFQDRYGIEYSCACDGSIQDERTRSDANSRGRQYANSKVRLCKHAYAALAFLESTGIIPDREPRTPVKPTAFARQFNATLHFRVFHGNKFLTQTEQEVILMRAIAPHLLGYDRMFDE